MRPTRAPLRVLGRDLFNAFDLSRIGGGGGGGVDSSAKVAGGSRSCGVGSDIHADWAVSGGSPSGSAEGSTLNRGWRRD